MIFSLLLYFVAQCECASLADKICSLEDVSGLKSKSEMDVKAAQKLWSAALVRIAQERTQGGDYMALAKEALRNLYAHDLMKPILFKPTMSRFPVFRNSLDGALSYFVGGNEAFPADSGFALKDWTAVECASNKVVTIGGVLLTNGHCALTDSTNATTIVDKSFVYVRDDNNTLRIVLHHSSLPVAPVKTMALNATVASAKPSDYSNDTAPISESEVTAALKIWADGIMSISNAHRARGDYRETASQMIQDQYAFITPSSTQLTLFKPTLAKDPPIRNDFDGALSYFAGGNANFSADTGFAIKGWTDAQCTINEVLSVQGMAFANGNCFFTALDGSVTKADKSWGYLRNADGSLKIVLHHSSLPYVSLDTAIQSTDSSATM